MISERHNLACSMIFEGTSKAGSLGSCFVCMDIGSSERLAMHKLQIPNTTETRNTPKWLFPPRFSDKNRCTSSRLGAVPVAPISAGKRNRLAMEDDGFLGVAGGNSAAPPTIGRSTFPRQHRLKFSSFFNKTITSSRSSTVRTLARRTS